MPYQPESFLRMRWPLVWKHAEEGGERKEKSLSHSPGVSTSESDFSHDFHHVRLRFGDVSPAFLLTSASEEHHILSINVPTEFRFLFPDSDGNPDRHVRLLIF